MDNVLFVQPIDVLTQQSQTATIDLTPDRWTSVLTTPKVRLAEGSGSYLVLFGQLLESRARMDVRVRFGKKELVRFSRVQIPTPEWSLTVDFEVFKDKVVTSLDVDGTTTIVKTTASAASAGLHTLTLQVRLRGCGQCTAALAQTSLACKNPTRLLAPFPVLFPLGAGVETADRSEPLAVDDSLVPVFDPGLVAPVAGQSLVAFASISGTSAASTSLRLRPTIGAAGAETAEIPIPAGDWNITVVLIGAATHAQVAVTAQGETPRFVVFDLPAIATAEWNLELAAATAGIVTVTSADLEVYAFPVDPMLLAEESKVATRGEESKVAVGAKEAKVAVEVAGEEARGEAKIMELVTKGGNSQIDVRMLRLPIDLGIDGGLNTFVGTLMNIPVFDGIITLEYHGVLRGSALGTLTFAVSWNLIGRQTLGTPAQVMPTDTGFTLLLHGVINAAGGCTFSGSIEFLPEGRFHSITDVDSAQFPLPLEGFTLHGGTTGNVTASIDQQSLENHVLVRMTSLSPD